MLKISFLKMRSDRLTRNGIAIVRVRVRSWVWVWVRIWVRVRGNAS